MLLGGSHLVSWGLTGYVYLVAKKYSKPRMSMGTPFGFQALDNLSSSGLAWTYLFRSLRTALKAEAPEFG